MQGNIVNGLIHYKLPANSCISHAHSYIAQCWQYQYSGYIASYAILNSHDYDTLYCNLKVYNTTTMATTRQSK